jgi:hypothetical protein
MASSWLNEHARDPLTRRHHIQGRDVRNVPVIAVCFDC